MFKVNIHGLSCRINSSCRKMVLRTNTYYSNTIHTSLTSSLSLRMDTFDVLGQILGGEVTTFTYLTKMASLFMMNLFDMASKIMIRVKEFGAYHATQLLLVFMQTLFVMNKMDLGREVPYTLVTSEVFNLKVRSP